MKNIKTLLLLFISLSLYSRANAEFEHAQTNADKVLTKLYNATGNYLYFKPKLEIQDSRTKVASYLPGSRTIVLEMAAYKICQSMGKDSMSALAFILGHELALSYQADVRNLGEGTNFLSYSDHIHTSVRAEKTADIQGAFMAYLAGYKTNRVIEKVIRKIYDAYKLRNKTMSKYPPFESRLAIAMEIDQKVEELIQLFETGNYLTALNQFEYASACYAYIDKYYQGQEIYNNWGVNLLLHAMNFTEKNVDFFLYPLEIELETRLKKPKARGDLKDLSPKEMRYRLSIISQAISQFEVAKKLNFGCFNCDINLMCAYNLRGDYHKTIAYYMANGLERRADLLHLSPFEKQKAQLALAIAYIRTKDSQGTGKKILYELSSSKDQLVSSMAQYNLKVMENPEYKNAVRSSSECPAPFNTSGVKDGVLVHRYSPQTRNIIDEKTLINYHYKKFQNSSVFNFSRQDGKSFTIQRIPVSTKKKMLIGHESIEFTSSTSKGFFLNCEEDRIIFLAKPNGVITEWAKYF